MIAATITSARPSAIHLPAGSGRDVACAFRVRRRRAPGDGRSALPKSPTGQAIAYAHSNWAALCRYPERGVLSIDNNLAERMLHAQALGRKNGTFLGSDRGGRTAAVLYSLTGTCTHHDFDPLAYPRDILTRLPSTPTRPLDELVPDVWFMTHASARGVTPMSEVTRLLEAIDRGEPQRARELLPIIYEELRRLADARLAREPAGQTLQATALVHEAYLRLAGDGDGRPWESRGHFFAAAAEAMRRILVEKARHRRRLRHGGGLGRVDLDQVDVVGDEASGDLLALHEALDRLAAEEPVVAEVVKLRYFAGLTAEQAALAMNISLRTANRHWAFARAWLYQQLNPTCDTSA